MTQEPEIGDGLEALNGVINAKEIARLVGELSRWVDPKTFRLLPVWFPDTARMLPSYNAKWTKQLTNLQKPKFEGNTNANMTLARALGTSTKSRPNWTCCHVWGNDDPTFASDSSEVNDRRYYSCPANMVLLPTHLKAFTDSVPQMKAAMRLAAFHLYGFLPEGRMLPKIEDAGEWLPTGWDRGEVIGIRPTNDRIRHSVQRRYDSILRDLTETPGKYPREQVRSVMRYWSEKISDFNLGGGL
ncbi:MAG: hypothetical protein ACU0DI_01910 [Paracoccaceae bacterium]